MKMRQRRKRFWQFPETQVFMRSHQRKVKPVRLHRWVRNKLEKRT